MASLIPESASKVFTAETLRSAAKQSERIHLVSLRLRRAIKRFLRGFLFFSEISLYISFSSPSSLTCEMALAFLCIRSGEGPHEQEGPQPLGILLRNQGRESAALLKHIQGARRGPSQVHGAIQALEDQVLLRRHRPQVQRRRDRRLRRLSHARRLLCLSSCPQRGRYAHHLTFLLSLINSF